MMIPYYTHMHMHIGCVQWCVKAGKVRSPASMEVTEIRAAIKYMYIDGKNAKEIHEHMQHTLGDRAPSKSTVKKWVRNFKCGHMSTETSPRSGRPKEVTIPEFINSVHTMIINDRRITIQHIVDTLKISYGTVHKIIHKDLGMVKLSARWVPRMLTDDQKRKRMNVCTELLRQFEADPELFLKRLVTQDETWVHHFDPESKSQSKEWHKKGSRPPKKFKRQYSAGKVMATVFWDSKGVIMTDYLEHGETINAAYYSDELNRLRADIIAKRRGKMRSGVLLLQDNASSHTAGVSVATAAKCGFKILPHPPYSPDLAPSDYFLFPNLKRNLRGRKFDDEEEVIGAVDQYLEDQEETFYRKGLMMLKTRWEKCIRLKGDYVEK